MPTKLSGRLPKADEENGLDAITADLTADPTQMHVVVAVVDCSKITLDTDTGESIPTARIRRVEVIENSDDKDRLRQLVTRAYEKRTGKTVLPLDLEDEMRSAFGTSD